jgi:hypothetical protein
MTRHDFRNAICILHDLDMHDLVAAGVIAERDGPAWQKFSSNPERFFLRCNDDQATALWTLIERRMQPRPVAPGIAKAITT